MALHSNLPIYRTVRELTQLAITATRNMPRDYKKTLGERLVGELLEISMRVLRANIARDKRPHLDELLERKEMADQLIRLAVDLRCISQGQYARLIELVDSVGKQAHGWRRHSAASPAA